LRRKLDYAVAVEGFAGLVESDHGAGAGFRPVQAEGQHQVAILVTRQGDGEVVVDTFFEFVVYRQPQRCRQVDFRLRDRIGTGIDCVDGHGVAHDNS
jgi:hypothetical protein